MGAGRLRAACVLSGCVALAAAGGCAAERAAAPEPATKSLETTPALDEPAPTTIEQAQAQLDRARAALAGESNAAAAPTTTTGAGAAGATGTSEAPRMEADQSTRGGACVTGCRAIASMRRAVDAICRLAGAQDARCTDARRTLGDSEGKVAGCGC